MSKARYFWPIIAGVVVTDVITKAMAERFLILHVPHRVLGEMVRLTLSYNQNAAFGISLGIGSRWTFVVLAIIALAVLAGLYRSTPAHQRWQIISLGLIAAGALGNVIDRVRSGRGVVDFIDVGIGDMRFWTFNVADSAITIGAIVLALTLWTAEEPGRGVEATAPPEDPGE